MLLAERSLLTPEYKLGFNTCYTLVLPVLFRRVPPPGVLVVKDWGIDLSALVAELFLGWVVFGNQGAGSFVFLSFVILRLLLTKNVANGQ